MFSSAYDFKDRGYRCPGFLASCFSCDCNLSECLQRTCCCCCPQLLTQQKPQYPHIEYEQVKTGDSREDLVSPAETSSPIKPVPIERIFKHAYSRTGSQEFPIHPQIGYTASTDGSSASSSTHRITEQPHHGAPPPLHSMRIKRSIPSDRGDDYQQEAQLKYDQSSVEMSSVLQYSISPHSSMEDLGAELGFIDSSSVPPAAGSFTSGTTSSSQSKLDIRITRTPESTLERQRRATGQPMMAAESSYLQQPLKMVTSRSESAIHQKLKKLSKHTSPQYPCVNFSLYYDDHHSTLIIHLYQAHKLPTKRSEEASNPFMEVYLLPRKYEVRQSHTAQRTLDPVFDQAFKFNNVPANEVENQMVVFRIYINDKNHFIGGVIYPLENVNMIGDPHIADIVEFDEDEYLRGTSQGDLLLSLCYSTKLSVLEIVILEANNLKKQDVIGLSNPYIKINMIYEGKRLLKWKTTVKKSTLMPVFNETCQLDLSNLNVRGLQLDILVMDYDRFGRNTEVGRVTLGNDVTHVSGQSHWRKVMQVANKMHYFWHPIKPVSAPSTPKRTRSQSRSRSPSVQSCMTPVGLQL